MGKVPQNQEACFAAREEDPANKTVGPEARRARGHLTPTDNSHTLI